MSKKKVKEPDRVLIAGKPDLSRCDNKVVSARYTALNFVFVAVSEQFRRFANIYFLVMGLIMFVGYYSPLFESAISPWTTLGPLCLVIAISLLVEGITDYKRHLNDHETNNAACVVLKRSDELEAEEGAVRDEHICKGEDVVVNVNKTYFFDPNMGKAASIQRRDTDPNDSTANVRVAFQKLCRQDIRQGHFVLIKNREMVPADIVLLASSNDQGSAYIETSSIDGETNLKLRTSPHLPKSVIEALREGSPMASISEEIEKEKEAPEGEDSEKQIETIDFATKRITRFSYLVKPDAASVMTHPGMKGMQQANTANGVVASASVAPGEEENWGSKKRNIGQKLKDGAMKRAERLANLHHREDDVDADQKYVVALTTEPPNASVHTFSGKLTFPPIVDGCPCYEIPLGADNVLLRGAVLRNTEWVIGLAFFTGKDTKLVQNSFQTPSKFSQLDLLINKTVVAILVVMGLCVVYLATEAMVTQNKDFSLLFYVGLNKDKTAVWPYLPDLAAPHWESTTQNWAQYFFLFLTLLNNFIPLSLYISVEFVQFFMLWLVLVDKDMYDDTTNTRGLARSTIVSDLGRIQYIFSDKTGTLTQNVMRFKRCSVDGMIFGAPIQRTRPGAGADTDLTSPFHPLRQLLVGRFTSPSGLEGLGGASSSDTTSDNKLTFNSEMFLRVMSLCHTVVVEKDIDKKEEINAGLSTTGSAHGSKMSISSYARSIFVGRKTSTSDSMQSPLGSVHEDSAFDPALPSPAPTRSRVNTALSLAAGEDPLMAKNSDGAPLGYAYQAESPDEGALVSAASSTYGFQVIARDSRGIRLRCGFPSHLQDESITEGLKSKKVNLERLAAETAHTQSDNGDGPNRIRGSSVETTSASDQREETWTILAVNKFDSDRKRMSILVRSPPDLGNLPILFCKGADSSMLDPEICGKSALLEGKVSTLYEDEDYANNGVDKEGWEMAHMLGMQVHLGEFAREGLRTLVLGMRVLTEQECTEWLDLHREAATSMGNRDALLTAAATQIEKDLHIVGATAIEDKLQKNVPETIATLAKAGIKLWVLTGDKRETAVEIGYSTHVLTSKMHLTEVPDNGKLHVRTQMAMEFIRLTKIGLLGKYQMAALDQSSGAMTFRKKMLKWLADFSFNFGKCRRSTRRLRMRFKSTVMKLFGMTDAAGEILEEVAKLEIAEKRILTEIERRRNVRSRADKTIKTWLQSDEAAKHRRASSLDGDFDDTQELALASEETPMVFVRAKSAQGVLQDMANSGELSQPELRQLSIAHLTAHQVGAADGKQTDRVVDEDTLSLESFVPGTGGDKADFDKKKRTLLERLFAVDREVRKGRLKKHLTTEKLAAIAEHRQPSQSVKRIDMANNRNVSRALVIEGAALKHLLGDPEFEEILFAVASNCEAVIACRVSPRQKALLVNLVRQNIDPEPITLAIGDGANDVGMIQEAHVGVGISGKEGKQAVNASDFAIAQFRFLETLILIHGRWNFFRLSILTLFSFYKNAVLAGILIVYTERTLYSGTPLFDEWILASLNFVAAWPIIFTGFFDRCLSKEYVRKHPEVYKATQENELITTRSAFRWILVCLAHIFILYYFTVPQQSYGGGITPAFLGLMRNNDKSAPGNGEGGDLDSVGTVTFTCLIFLLAYKVLYESRSLLHGKWPQFTCRKGVGEGFVNRLAYTWIGVTILSICFYLVLLACYELAGRGGASSFTTGFTMATNHILGTRSMSWLLILFVPIIAMIFDVCGKVFSNMFYPTQTQIHLELESKGKMIARRRGLPSSENARRRIEAGRQNSTEPQV